MEDLHHQGTGRGPLPDRQEVLAMALLRGSDQTKCGSLLGHLANQYASGCDKYPKDLTTAYSTRVHYKTPSDAKQRSEQNGNNNSGTTNGNANRGGNQSRPTNTGNTATNTPTAGAPSSTMTFAQGADTSITPVGTVTVPSSTPATGASLVQYAVMMTQGGYEAIDPWSILLDSQSTIFCF
jgi:hypothetical protein